VRRILAPIEVTRRVECSMANSGYSLGNDYYTRRDNPDVRKNRLLRPHPGEDRQIGAVPVTAQNHQLAGAAQEVRS
jgi:hypothetical protein